MEEIINSVLLTNEKSTFLIEKVMHHSGKHYVRIKQVIEPLNNSQQLVINLDLLPDIVAVLSDCLQIVPLMTPEKSGNFLKPEKQRAIIKNYLKGMSIADLAFINNCSGPMIKQIILGNGLELIDNKLPAKGKRNKKR